MVAPPRAAVLGAHVVGDDLELGHRVRRRLHHLVREALVAGAVGVVVDAVEQVVVEGAAQAVDVERALARRWTRCRCRGRTGARRWSAATSAEYSRPFSGSATACSCVITWPRWLESVSSALTSAVTIDRLGDRCPARARGRRAGARRRSTLTWSTSAVAKPLELGASPCSVPMRTVKNS